jgi:hypothetical protein
LHDGGADYVLGDGGVGPGGELWGETESHERGDALFASGEGVGADWDLGDEDWQRVWVVCEDAVELQCDAPRCISPVARLLLRAFAGELDLAEEVVDDVDHELFFADDVAVERCGAGVQALGEQAHVERGCSDFVEQVDGCIDDLVERAGRASSCALFGGNRAACGPPRWRAGSRGGGRGIGRGVWHCPFMATLYPKSR